ncbi:UDP-glucuronosyltransferase 1-7C [Folsomia candida]|nr:UDP-glucuronosyltransferase 1-7C [Folsomia candida]
MNHDKVKDLVIPELAEMLEYLISKFDINYRIQGLQPSSLFTLDPVSYAACQAVHRSPTFQAWVATIPSIDLIYSDTNPECAYGLAAKFGAKHAIFQTIPLSSKQFEVLGISSEAGSIPPWEMSDIPPLSFYKRTVGTFLPFIGRVQQLSLYRFLYKSLFVETLGLETPPELYDMEADISLLLINGNYLEDYARSLPPFVVKVPGMHIRENLEAEQLDPSLEAFISSSSDDTDGFIYISFGTVVNASNLPKSFLDIFFRSIEAFPTLQFIWRWKGPIPSPHPKNLLFTPWVNQQKLLSHGKIRGFITQAGRPSMQEAFYHAVPTIAFPILGDQDFNAAKYEYLGTAVCMDIATVTQPQLMIAINRTVTDTAWIGRVNRMASLARDVPITPVKMALWWTEFILRHTPEEINFLKPLGQQSDWWKRRELDVWAFVILFSVVVSLVIFRLTRPLRQSLWKMVKSLKSKLD